MSQARDFVEAVSSDSLEARQVHQTHSTYQRDFAQEAMTHFLNVRHSIELKAEGIEDFIQGSESCEIETKSALDFDITNHRKVTHEAVIDSRKHCQIVDVQRVQLGALGQRSSVKDS